MTQDACLSLPSATTAYRLVQGDTTAWPCLLRDLVGRAVLIGTGVKIAGGSWKESAKYGGAGAAAIEVFVLCYATYKLKLAK